MVLSPTANSTAGTGGSPARTPLSAPARITVAALLGIAALYAYYTVALLAAPNWELTPITAVPLLCAALVATGRPWAPLLGPAMAVAVLASPVRGDIAYNLARPEEIGYFTYTVALLGVVGVAITAGLGAALLNGRRGQAAAGPAHRYPAWYTALLASVTGLILGAILGATLAAADPQAGAGAGLSDGELATLPTFTMTGLRFEPAQLQARVGETVAVRYTNRDGLPHAFDLDEFAVHVPVPSGRTGAVVFTPTKPGTYVFYCGVGDHRAAGMVGTLIVAP